MINPDEIDPPRPVAKPAELGSLSVKELQEYIVSLETEIERARAMIESKQAHRSGADSLFKF